MTGKPVVGKRALRLTRERRGKCLHVACHGQTPQLAMKEAGRIEIAGGKDHTAKARPVVLVVRDEGLDVSNSITMCTFITDGTGAPRSGRVSSRWIAIYCAQPAGGWWTR